MSGGTITSDFAMLTAQLLERLGELVIFSNENARLFSTNRQVRWVWIKLQDSEKLQMDCFPHCERFQDGHKKCRIIKNLINWDGGEVATPTGIIFPQHRLLVGAFNLFFKLISLLVAFPNDLFFWGKG